MGNWHPIHRFGFWLLFGLFGGGQIAQVFTVAYAMGTGIYIDLATRIFIKYVLG